MTTKISSDNIQTASLQIIGGGPTVSNIQITDSSYVVSPSSNVSTSAGGYIKITGTKFASGAQVYIGTTIASSVSLVGTTVLNVRVSANAASAGNVFVYVINTDGSYCIKPNGLRIV